MAAAAAAAAVADEWSYSLSEHGAQDGRGENALRVAAEKLGRVLVKRDQGDTSLHIVLLRGHITDRSDEFLASVIQLLLRIALMCVPHPEPRLVDINVESGNVSVSAKYNTRPSSSTFIASGISISWYAGTGQYLLLDIKPTRDLRLPFSSESYNIAWPDVTNANEDECRAAALNILDDMIGRVEVKFRTQPGRQSRLDPIHSVALDAYASPDWRSAFDAFYTLLYELDNYTNHADIRKDLFKQRDRDEHIDTIKLDCRARPYTLRSNLIGQPQWSVPHDPRSFGRTGWLLRLLGGQLQKTPEQLAREAAEREAAVAAGRPPPLQMSYLLPVGVRDIVARLAGVCIDTPVARGADGALLPSEPARFRTRRAADALRESELARERDRREQAMQADRAAHDAEGRPRRPSDDDDDNEGLD